MLTDVQAPFLGTPWAPLKSPPAGTPRSRSGSPPRLGPRGLRGRPAGLFVIASRITNNDTDGNANDTDDTNNNNFVVDLWLVVIVASGNAHCTHAFGTEVNHG